MPKERLFDDAYVRLSKPGALSCGRGMDGFSNGAVAIVEQGVVFQCGGKQFTFPYEYIQSVEEYRYATIPPRLCLRVTTMGNPPELYVTFFGFLGTKGKKLRKLKAALDGAMGG